MRRFRIRRRRALALALVPAAALTIGSEASNAAPAERQAAIDPARAAVPFGERVTLRGQFPGAPRRQVAIQYRAANGKRFRQVATTRTNEHSRWSARVKPRGTGMWRARLSSAPRPAAGEDELLETAQPVDPETGAKRVRVRALIDVHAKNHVTVGRDVEIAGKVKPGGNRKVVVRVGGKKIKTRADRRGRFDVDWHAGSTGTYKVSADARGNARATGASDRGGKVTVYRSAAASWYGPGFYGNRTACGQTLTSGMLGVAHKTMPCGTKLKLRHRGRTVKVEVIDRGPYAGDREFDLTEATRNKLGFGSTGTVLTSK
jgi:rare lipoprotein A (peptidoglycan hydrolase)